MILSEMIGNYSQTIRINVSGENTLEITRGGETLFNGIAKHIIDSRDRISFKDENDTPKEFIKYSHLMTWA